MENLITINQILLSVIQADLKQHRLTSMLHGLGLEDPHCTLELFLPVFELVGFTDEQVEELKLYEFYLQEKEKITQILNHNFIQNLPEISENILIKLLEVKQRVAERVRVNSSTSA